MKNIPSLKHFILQHNALVLFREALKVTAAIKDTRAKADLRKFIRDEFESTRNEKNEKTREFLCATARKKINEFKEHSSWLN